MNQPQQVGQNDSSQINPQKISRNQTKNKIHLNKNSLIIAVFIQIVSLAFACWVWRSATNGFDPGAFLILMTGLCILIFPILSAFFYFQSNHYYRWRLAIIGYFITIVLIVCGSIFGSHLGQKQSEKLETIFSQQINQIVSNPKNAISIKTIDKPFKIEDIGNCSNIFSGNYGSVSLKKLDYKNCVDEQSTPDNTGLVVIRKFDENSTYTNQYLEIYQIDKKEYSLIDFNKIEEDLNFIYEIKKINNESVTLEVRANANLQISSDFMGLPSFRYFNIVYNFHTGNLTANYVD